MKINVTYTDKVQAALDTVQTGRMTSNLVSVSDIQAAAISAENAIKKMLSARERSGSEFIHTPAGAYANTYKYRKSGTAYVLQRGSKYWYLVNVWRVQRFCKQPEINNISIPACNSDIAKNRLFAAACKL